MPKPAAAAFIRIDAPDHLPSDIHIPTASKQPWVPLPPGMPTVEEYYDRERYLGGAESLGQWRVLAG